jgi:hypothetical protein
MTNRPRGKGTSAETMLVDYLQANGFPYAERRSLKGGKDQGDITGCRGLVFEVKWAHAGIRMSEWVEQMVVERNNAQADHGVLVIKTPGLGVQQVGKWLTVMMPTDHDKLLEKSPLSVHLVDPVLFRSPQLRLQLNKATRAVMAHAHDMVALQAYPPGKADWGYVWYRIGFLDDTVRLLRSAGYGEPEAPLSLLDLGPDVEMTRLT